MFAFFDLLAEFELGSLRIPVDSIENLVEQTETSPIFRLFWRQNWRVGVGSRAVRSEASSLIGNNPKIFFLRFRELDDNGLTRV